MNRKWDNVLHSVCMIDRNEMKEWKENEKSKIVWWIWKKSEKGRKYLNLSG